MIWWRLQILGPNYSLFYTCLPALLVVCLKNRPHWKHTTTRRTVQSARAATHYLEFARWFCLSSRKPFSHWLLELRDLLPFCPALYCTLEAILLYCTCMYASHFDVSILYPWRRWQLLLLSRPSQSRKADGRVALPEQFLLWITAIGVHGTNTLGLSPRSKFMCIASRHSIGYIRSVINA